MDCTSIHVHGYTFDLLPCDKNFFVCFEFQKMLMTANWALIEKRFIKYGKIVHSIGFIIEARLIHLGRAFGACHIVPPCLKTDTIQY